MAYWPPHAWNGRHGGYQPPEDLFGPHNGLPGFLDPHPAFDFGLDGPPQDYFDGPPDLPPGFFDNGGPLGMMPPPPPPPPPPHFGSGPPGGGFFGPWGGPGGSMPLPPLPPPPPPPPYWHRGRGYGPWRFGPDYPGDGDDGDLPRVANRRGGRNGVGMIYNPKQTRLHVFQSNDLTPWADAKKRAVVVRKTPPFNIWEADVGWTVKQLLEYLGKGDDKWAITEVVEAGNGRWYRGSTIKHKDERAAETLATQGWTDKRGKPFGQTPVWVIVHKVED